MQHLLQSPDWEQYQALEQKTTFRRKGEDFEFLAILETTPLGNYLYLPYGPTLYPKSKPSNNPKSTHKINSKSTPKTPNSNRTKDQKATQKAFQHALEALAKLSHEHNATFARIEPTEPLLGPQGIFQHQSLAKLTQNLAKNQSDPKNQSNHPLPKSYQSPTLKKTTDLNPAHTWILDLTQPESEILNNIESRKTRYYRNYPKKGITIKTSNDPKDIKILTKLLKSLGEKDNFIPQNEPHLKNQLKSKFATLYIAYLDQTPNSNPTKTTDQTNSITPSSNPQTPIAAALIYDDETTRYYAHAASDQTYKNLSAGTILIIQMILDAKNAHKTTFDFWGIAPENADHAHPWYGFSLYKKSFGGQQKTYAGTYDIIYKPFKYRLYSALRALNRRLRKLTH